MTTRSSHHSETAAALLLEARSCLDEGDLPQASEKGWEAAAYLLETIAEQRGWPHAWEGDLFIAVDRIVTELDDERVGLLFLSASALQQNFYEGWMPAGSVAAGLNSVEEFARRLDDLID